MKDSDNITIQSIKSKRDGVENVLDIDDTMVGLGFPNHYGYRTTAVEMETLAETVGCSLYSIYEQEDSVTLVGNSANTILTYSFTEQTGAATIDDENYTVDIEVASATDVTELAATFTTSDKATVYVDETEQVSGTTENDFTSAVTYTVTAEDGTSQDWTITVTIAE
jgi:hypothetical protein